ncbi:MAG: GntR family transcriptional regulator [Bacteroidales bacterium]|nr:GntR family transcriptional regulator [Bacteroidales bacterium]
MKIKSGNYEKGHQLPSLNELTAEYGIAKDTVVKAFKELQAKKMIFAVHGKGFFVSPEDNGNKLKVMLIVDKLSPYKQLLCMSIIEQFGLNATVNIFFHHFNLKILRSILSEYAAEYTHFIMIPFEHPEFEKCIEPIASAQLYFIDFIPRSIRKNYPGVFQDFENDIVNALADNKILLRKYNKLILLNKIKDTSIPFAISHGFSQFCTANKLPYEIISGLNKNHPVENAGYIISDDNDLVEILIRAKKAGYKTGKDIGIISYNESPLKQVIADGISVFSTDFIEMASSIAKMIINHEKKLVRNSFIFIDRNSF